MRKIVFFELNEVPHPIVEKFCQWQPRSTLATVLPRCTSYETFSEDEGILSPWITWPTLHRGVTNQKHLVSNFGQSLNDVDAEYPPLWKLLAGEGVSVGICGSLHSYPMPANHTDYSFYIPDTFAAGSECFPRDLSKFQEFNLRMARESSRNVSASFDWQSALAFLYSAPGLGLKPRTALDVGLQLMSEKLARWKKVRRRTYQSVLAFDVYFHFLEKKKPAFSTFFTNHVASSMHRYWAARFPEDYTSMGFDDQWIGTYSGEIEFTMTKTDAFITRLIDFANRNPEYQIWILSSMGQEATEAQPIETQLYLKDKAAFMSFCGIEREHWQDMPAMLPRVVFSVAEEKIGKVVKVLEAMQVCGQAVDWGRLNEAQLFLKLGHRNLHATHGCVTVGGSPVELDSLGFEHVEIDDLSGTTAYHIPQGCLFIYDPRQPARSTKRASMSTLDIAPAILRNFQVQSPAYMNSGATLAPR
jgi:hypothetical protein